MKFKYYLRGAGIGVIVATLILSIAFLMQDNISDEEVIRRAIKLGMVMEENTSGTLADLQQSGATAVDLESGADGENPDSSNASDSNKENEDSSNKADDSNKDLSKPENSSDNKSGDDTEGTAAKDSDQDTKNDSNHTNDQKKDQNQDETSNNHTDAKPDQTNDTKPADDASGSTENQPEPNADSQSDEVVIVIESGDVSRMVSAKVFEAGLVESADEFNSYLGAHDYDNMLQPGTHIIPKGSNFQQIAQILTSRQ